MKYPFLEKNELVLVDYSAGSCGQLFMRIWKELDMRFDISDELLTKQGITTHPASREVIYDVVYPKRVVNWFFDKNEPKTNDEIAMFFEMLATMIFAKSKPWNKNSHRNFYDNSTYEITNEIVLYGMHLWSIVIDWGWFIERGLNIKSIVISPSNYNSFAFSVSRSMACYPIDLATQINNNLLYVKKDGLDFCNYLIHNNTNDIIDIMSNMIGVYFRNTRIDFVKDLISLYYKEIVCEVDDININEYWSE